MSFGEIAPLAIGAIGAIAGMGGSKPPTNPYSGRITEQANKLNDDADAFGGMSKRSQSGYDTLDPQYKDAANSYADYLRSDPYTDANSTRALGQATQGVNAAYTGAQSSLAASNAARGLSLDSSNLQGGLASIEGNKAAQMAGAQNTLALQKMATHRQNAEMLAEFLHSARNDERGATTGALQSSAGITGQQAGIYSGLNNSANDVAISQQKRSDDSNNALFGALGQLAGTI